MTARYCICCQHLLTSFNSYRNSFTCKACGRIKTAENRAKNRPTVENVCNHLEINARCMVCGGGGGGNEGGKLYLVSDKPTDGLKQFELEALPAIHLDCLRAIQHPKADPYYSRRPQVAPMDGGSNQDIDP